MATVALERHLILGRYRPLRPLGSGGMGHVWLACDEETGLDVALKIVARDGKAAARAEREARAAASLRHPRCQRIYALARDARLELLQAEYRLDRRGDGLVPYRITLPLRGTYGQVRDFVGATLQSFPNASIDGLRFERKNPGDAHLDAQVRLTVYFRPNSNEGAQ